MPKKASKLLGSFFSGFSGFFSSVHIFFSGFGLSDDPENPFLETLSGLVIEPGGYALVEPAAFGIAWPAEPRVLSDKDRIWPDFTG